MRGSNRTGHAGQAMVWSWGRRAAVVVMLSQVGSQALFVRAQRQREVSQSLQELKISCH